MISPTAVVAEDEAALRGELVEQLGKLWPELAIVGEAADGLEALRLLDQQRPDILFLDIEMPGATGIDVARQVSGRAHVVFVTAYDQYALQAFEAAAVDYLLKPVTPARLAGCVQRLQSSLAQPAPQAALDSLRQLLAQAVAPVPRLRHLQAAVGDTIELVPVDELVYLEAADKYVRAVTAEREFWVRVSLRELLPQLDTERFWQVHRSTVVHIDAVARAHRQDNGTVLLELRRRSERLTVSRVHAHRFKAL